MALGDDYITLTQLKNRLGPIEDTDDDSHLQGVIPATTDGIYGVTNRDFQHATTATARTYKPTNPVLVITADFHTTDDLVIAVDADDDGIYETTLTAGDYELEPADGVVNGREGWPFWKIRLVNGTAFPCNRRRSVQVTAKWGWAAVPPAVTEAALILAEDLAKLKDTPFGAGGFGEFGRIRARENPFVMTRLQPFMRNTIKVGG